MKKAINKYIITIDDDDDFNSYLKLLLNKVGIRSSVTKSPEKFLKKLKENNPDLCLIDLNLDIASGAGFQLIQAIRKIKGNDITIFVLSRRSTSEDIEKAFKLGANDFISKPLDDAIFLSKIEKFLDLRELTKTLPLYSIDEKDSPCEFSLYFNLLELTEYKLKVKSLNFLDIGQVFYITGPILNEIYGTSKPLLFSVTHYEKHNDHFHLDLSYDNSSPELRFACRKWLLENSTIF